MGLNNKKLLALVNASQRVSLNPVTGNQIACNEMRKRLKNEYGKSVLRAFYACTSQSSACKKCTKLFAIKKQFDLPQLAGNFIKEDIDGICLVEFSAGSHVISYIYDIGNIKDYTSRDKFEFDSCYCFLSEKITLILGQSIL